MNHSESSKLYENIELENVNPQEEEKKQWSPSPRFYAVIAVAVSIALVGGLIGVVAMILARDEAHSSASSPGSLDERKQFEIFMQTYNKTYPSSREESLRFDIFKKNLKIIAEYNRDGTIGTHGVNKFADIEQNEFLAMYTGYLEPESNASNATGGRRFLRNKAGDPPAPINWVDRGATTPVEFQGTCGSCWAFAAAEQIESDYFLATGKLVRLSEQQLVDCDTSNSGCGGGWPQRAYAYVHAAGGLVPWSDYQYRFVQGQCNVPQSNEKVQVSGWNVISKYPIGAPAFGNEAAMASAIANGPMSVCLDSSKWQSYSGGILGKGCGRKINHCVQLVGAGVTVKNGKKKGYWIIRNSWGADWGNNGYAKIKFGTNACGITKDATTVNIAN